MEVLQKKENNIIKPYFGVFVSVFVHADSKQLLFIVCSVSLGSYLNKKYIQS